MGSTRDREDAAANPGAPGVPGSPAPRAGAARAGAPPEAPAAWPPPRSPRAAPGSWTVRALRLPAFGILTRFHGSGPGSPAAILGGGGRTGKAERSERKWSDREGDRNGEEAVARKGRGRAGAGLSRDLGQSAASGEGPR